MGLYGLTEPGWYFSGRQSRRHFYQEGGFKPLCGTPARSFLYGFTSIAVDANPCQRCLTLAQKSVQGKTLDQLKAGA